MSWPTEEAQRDLQRIIGLASAASQIMVVIKANTCASVHPESDPDPESTYPTVAAHEAWVKIALSHAQQAQWSLAEDALDHVGSGVHAVPGNIQPPADTTQSVIDELIQQRDRIDSVIDDIEKLREENGEEPPPKAAKRSSRSKSS